MLESCKNKHSYSGWASAADLPVARMRYQQPLPSRVIPCSVELNPTLLDIVDAVVEGYSNPGV